jgi:uncharacterized delta-60 repeat protein
MARGPGGTLVLGGSSHDAAGNPTMMATRYLADGSPDRSFGDGGIAATSIAMDTSRGFTHVLAQPDGKVVLTGQRDYQFELVRLDPSGRPDPTFGNAGVVRAGAPGPLFCGPAALQANGKIVLGGQEQLAGSNRRFAVARFVPDGALDVGFAGGFVYSFLGPFDYADIGALVLQPDGRIVAIGAVGDSHSNLYLGALRLLGDGPGGAPADPDALGWLPPANRPQTAAGATSSAARRASLRATLRSLRASLATRRARRALRKGGLTLRVALPAGNRLTLALARVRSPHRTIARGSVRARQAGRARLRLRTTRAGMRVLRTNGPVRVTARVRLLLPHGSTLAASTAIRLPALKSARGA